MSTLIIGGDGLIGKALRQALISDGVSCVTTSRRSGAAESLDLADDIGNWSPPDEINLVVVCAALTSLSACSKDPARARRINIEAPEGIARLASQRGIPMVFLSTSLVFGGTAFARPADPLQPETEYGRQKAEAEVRIGETGCPHAIVRLTKVVHPELAIFREWAGLLRSGKKIRPFSDMFFSPILLAEVVEVLRHLVMAFEPGIFHLSGDRDISYSESALWLASALGADAALVDACSWRESCPGLGFVPRHTTLSRHLPANADMPVSGVKTALEEVFQAIAL